MLSKLGLEISHFFTYKEYTAKQRIIQWFLYLLRNLADILSGIVGILTFGLIRTYWGVLISEKILKNQMKYYKENKYG